MSAAQVPLFVFGADTLALSFAVRPCTADHRLEQAGSNRGHVRAPAAGAREVDASDRGSHSRSRRPAGSGSGRRGIVSRAAFLRIQWVLPCRACMDVLWFGLDGWAVLSVWGD